MSASDGRVEVVDIIFDGPPAHESGRFIEVEDSSGLSVNVGEWLRRPDGNWALRIRAVISKPKRLLSDEQVAGVMQRVDKYAAHESGWIAEHIAAKGRADVIAHLESLTVEATP